MMASSESSKPEESPTASNDVLESGVSSVPSSMQGPPQRLTIQGKTKIEKEWDSKSRERNVNRIIPIIKTLATIITGLFCLACSAVSKYSILKLSYNITTQVDDRNGRIKSNSRFVVIYILFVCPHIFNLLRSLWAGSLRRDMPWPSPKAILWAVLESALECCGLCIFAFKVFGLYSPVVNLVLMNTVYIVPITLSTKHLYSIRHRRPIIKRILYIVSVFLILAGTICILKVSFDETVRNGKTASFYWHIILAFVLLTIAWSQSVQYGLADKNRQEKTQNNAIDYQSASDTINTHTSSSTSGFSSRGSSQSTDQQLNSENHGTHTKKKVLITDCSTYWKMGIVINTFHVFFISLFSFIFYFVDNNVYSTSLYFTDVMYDEFKTAWSLSWNEDTKNLLLNITASFLGYTITFFACHIAIQRPAFIFTVLLSTILSPIVLMPTNSCKFFFPETDGICYPRDELSYIIVSLVLIFMALVSFSINVFRRENLLLQKQEKIFLTPTFNGILLDQCLMLNKRGILELPVNLDPRRTGNKTRVYICTTMYRETSEEMRVLLESINQINLSQMEGGGFFESHIVFDGGIRKRSLTKFALQLIGLLKPVLGISTDEGTKLLTPYGMKLSWRLPCERGKKSMTLSLHLKDNAKVKNKKRWSQIMYMSYVLDQLVGDAMEDEDCFILTTDADVKFTPDSVEALLDLMLRDKSVGAVCARTHPMGGGPLVWYQVFDYAIGHWFQKAAEHILGSVLCAPGCFSVYRCQALADVLPEYATTVEHAIDFLIKDMGEDRWLCTLMVQSGWRIEYCAAAENSTNCPADFDEFYKQRRRWIASTIANLMLILKKWYLITGFNHRVSILFIVYQGALLLSTLVGPSTIIILISGGLTYAWGIDSVPTIILQMVLCFVFVAICLKAPSTTQLQAAKILTFIYAVIMTAVTVGTIEQFVEDLDHLNSNETSPEAISVDLPLSVSTIYFGGLVAIFIITALIHLKEFTCVLNGLWYLLCLPSGYVILNLYSICNLTDRSWGTREEKTHLKHSREPWYKELSKILRQLCFCCIPATKSEAIERKEQSDEAAVTKFMTGDDRSDEQLFESPSEKERTSLQKDETDTEKEENVDEIETWSTIEPIPIEAWLQQDLKKRYLHLFQKHGYDTTLFVSGITQKDLEKIGIRSKAHIHFILEQIKLLPLFEIEFDVPVNVDEWLESIGLEMYKANFKRCQIRKPYELQILKTYTQKECTREVGISKDGHIKRLMYAISKLRIPTDAERQAYEVKKEIEMTTIHLLKQSNIGEHDFWKALIDQCLTPGQEAFSIEVELKDALNNMRSSWLMILAVTNILWLILISTLASKVDLTIIGANPISLAFLVIFGAIFVIQFLSMLVHRIQTLTHFLARAPFWCRKPYRTNWSFSDQYAFENQSFEDVEAISHVKNAERQAKRVIKNAKETTALLKQTE